MNMLSKALRERAYLKGQLQIEGMCSNAADTIDRLESLVAELQKDKTRVDWLGLILPTVHSFASGRIRIYDDGCMQRFDAQSTNIRTAIDLAMKQEKESK